MIMMRRRRMLLPRLLLLLVLFVSSASVSGSSSSSSFYNDNNNDEGLSYEEGNNNNVLIINQQQQQDVIKYDVTEYWFNTTLDHFNYKQSNKHFKMTFPLRYYVNDDSYDGNEDGPCLFYAGNEADIWQFINNTGYMFELAIKLKAIIVFAEHRYYGKSYPLLVNKQKASSNEGDLLQYLTVEQAMEDYNLLNLHIRSKWNMTTSQSFIVFGGSYGGNLAMWLRLKNPNLWGGAIASSATPLKHLLRETNGFSKIENDVYANVSTICPNLIKLGWKQLYDQSKTLDGRKIVEKELGLCSSSSSSSSTYYSYDDNDNDDDENSNSRLESSLSRSRSSSSSSWTTNTVHGWISNGLETMVQYGYPYPTNFYQPVPAYPFKVACLNMFKLLHNNIDDGTNNNDDDDDDLNNKGLRALKAGIDVYYNSTGQAGNCYNFDTFIKNEAIQYYKRKGYHDRLFILEEEEEELEQQQQQRESQTKIQNIRQQQQLQQEEEEVTIATVKDIIKDVHSWEYQTCTEVYQPMPTNGITDFELPYQPNQTAYFERCQRKFGVTPRPNWEEMYFMGSNIFGFEKTGSSGSSSSSSSSSSCGRSGGNTNIFLTSGELDPWRAAGIVTYPKSLNGGQRSSIIIRIIENGAHHLDLRSSNNKYDPPSVKQVREEQYEAIIQWINEWKELYYMDE